MSLRNKTSIRLGVSALALSAALATPAFAQDGAEVSEVVVTGTSIRGIAAVGSPAVGLTGEDIKASGAATASEITRMLPQVLNLGADESRSSFTGGAQDAAANSTAVNSVNLRGVGPEATLLLLNGRRLPAQGVIKALADINLVPTPAVSRLEVVADGASAIYGSDAVAGVVNIITRRPFDGAETTLRYGGADGFDQQAFSQTYGKTWEGGGVFMAYEHYRRGALSGGERDFGSQDRRSRGGSDNRSFLASPGNVITGTGAATVRYQLPGGTGVGLTRAAIVQGPGNRFDEGSYADILPYQKRDTVLLNARHHVDDRLEVWYEGVYSRHKFDLAAPPSSGTFTVPNTNAFFVVPAAITPLPTSVRVEYRLLAENPDPNSTGWENAASHAVGFNFDVAGDWQLSAYIDHGVNRGFQHRGNVVNNAALTAALNASNPATAFNVFGDGRFNVTNNAGLVDIIDAYRDTYGTSLQQDFAMKADGSLMSLPGGAMRLAVGAEYHHNVFKQTLNATNVLASGAVLPKVVLNRRNNKSVFAELFAPLVGEANAMPGIQRLELSLAGRYETYSDFGSTSNPKVGVVYSPLEGLFLRATYGTSFRAPSLVDGAGQIHNIFIQNLTDPTGVGGVTRGIFHNGGNPALQPEEATTWSFGADYRPTFLDGLELSATYYKIEYSNRIDVVPNTALTNAAIYAPYILRRPAASDAAGTATFNAIVTAFMNDPDLQNPVEAVSGINAIIDGRRQNLGALVQDGYDLSIGYRFSSGFGDWRVGVDVSKILTQEKSAAKGLPNVDVLDTFGNSVDLRYRASLTWKHARWSAAGFVNYTDGYRNTAVTPNVGVDSFTTLDGSVSYAVDKGDGPLGGLRFTLSGQNLFDEDPPIVLNGNFSWDSQQASPIGRFVAFEISKSW